MTIIHKVSDLDQDLDDVTSFWRRYITRVSQSNQFTDTALKVLVEDARLVHKLSMPQVFEVSSHDSTNTHKSGLVMGSVQSGKTASMLGVSALSLDKGLDVLVILAGTRISLWKQTYDRFVQSFGVGIQDNYFPKINFFENSDATRLSPDDLYKISEPMARRALRDKTPIIYICLKQVDHLRALSNALKKSIFPAAEQLGRDLSMLVLDDEADDGSILDSEIELNLDPIYDKFKKIPRHIENLWITKSASKVSRLHSCYTAYTATPQSNFTQRNQNPLSPKNFVFSLRTPFDTGEITPREITFREPMGLAHFYTGGDIFYARDNEKTPFFVSDRVLDMQNCRAGDENAIWISESIRCFLMAGAIRLLSAPLIKQLSDTKQEYFQSENDILSRLPSPHSMLIHTSGSIDDHFSTLTKVLEWTNDLSVEDANAAARQGLRTLSREVLKKDMDGCPDSWIKWFGEFEESTNWLNTRFSIFRGKSIPSSDSWDTVKNLILSEIIPNLKLKVINSDSESDDRPDFSPKNIEGKGWSAPEDIYTIFISGNIMSRGFTLEGLTTSLYLRSTAEPAADTQIQMQRWFGYRGSYIELCRLFTYENQFKLFEQYHEIEQGMRMSIIKLLNGKDRLSNIPTVFEGLDFSATKKITGLRKVPLSPDPTPYISLVNNSKEVDPNIAILEKIFTSDSRDVTVNGKLRGRILIDPVSLDRIADVLDSLTYNQYIRNVNDPEIKRWSDLADQTETEEARFEFYRGPKSYDDAEPSCAIRSCPYSIAAYLRLWSYLTHNSVSGLVANDSGKLWTSLSITEREMRSPQFYVGIRFGQEDALSNDKKFKFGISNLDFEIFPSQKGVSQGKVSSTWGSHNHNGSSSTYQSDEIFDNYYHQKLSRKDIDFIFENKWRPLGSPGLLLFQLIMDRNSSHFYLTCGLSFPLGGPEIFAATSRSVRDGDTIE